MTRPHHERRTLVARRFQTLPREELEAWVVQLLAHHDEAQTWLANHTCPASPKQKPSNPNPRSTP